VIDQSEETNRYKIRNAKDAFAFAAWVDRYIELATTCAHGKRSIGVFLPVPEPETPTITELDARNAKAPLRFESMRPKERRM